MMSSTTNGLAEFRAYRPRAGVPWALMNVIVIDGTGGPAYGPTHIVVQDERIVRVFEKHHSLAGLSGGEYRDAEPDEVSPEHRFDLQGMHVLPGFIDSHSHVGAPDQVESKDYVYKLWLGHGITRVREVGSLGIPFETMVDEATRIERAETLGPLIHPYLAYGTDAAAPLASGDDARAWVQRARERGAAGVKFFGAAPEQMRHAIDEARTLGMGTACHHSQQTAPRANALQTARWGLNSVEHSYGQAEVMYGDRLLPAIPSDYNYSDERVRFEELGRLWVQGARPSDAAWEDFIDELVDLDTTLVPTFTVYNAARDVERVRNREWAADYISPQLARFFTPCEHRHGSFYSDWGTEQETVWKQNYQVWMRFVRDFSLRGGRVCAGSDAGFIHSHYGFSFIDELELMREMGMAPLEIIRAATLHAAELLGIDDEAGTIENGKRADLVVLHENPLANLKVLYGHGHYRADAEGNVFRRGGVEVTVLGGRPVDSKRMLAEVRDFVEDQRHGPGAAPAAAH